MLLVSEEEMKRLKQEKISHNPKESLDDEMNKILDNTQLSKDEKWKLYQQVLHRYLNAEEPAIKVAIAENSKKSSQIDNEEMKFENFCKYMPPRFRTKGMQLMQLLSSIPDIKWDNLGEVSVGGEPIHGSNICDIALDIIRPSTFEPAGWQEVGQVLSKSNIPQSLITNAKRRMLINSLEDVNEPTTKRQKYADMDELFGPGKFQGKETSQILIKNASRRKLKNSIDEPMVKRQKRADLGELFSVNNNQQSEDSAEEPTKTGRKRSRVDYDVEELGLKRRKISINRKVGRARSTSKVPKITTLKREVGKKWKGIREDGGPAWKRYRGVL